MTQLGLFGDAIHALETYVEDYTPGMPSCYDCIELDQAWNGWRAPSRCTLTGRDVDRTIGKCECWKGKEMNQ